MITIHSAYIRRTESEIGALPSGTALLTLDDSAVYRKRGAGWDWYPVRSEQDRIRAAGGFTRGTEEGIGSRGLLWRSRGVIERDSGLSGPMAVVRVRRSADLGPDRGDWPTWQLGVVAPDGTVTWAAPVAVAVGMEDFIPVGSVIGSAR